MVAEKTAVVVIGGGYAGVMAANRLTRRDDVDVTLVNPRETFVERIRLHQLVSGSEDGVVDYRKVLAGRVRLLVDTATRIDASARRVILAEGGPIGYDYLVYAVGSASATLQVPGVAEFAWPIATFEEADRLRSVLSATPGSAAVTVVGAGPAGIETAAEVAATGRPVSLVCGAELGPSLHPRARRSVAKHLTDLGVTVLDGPEATVTAVTRDAVQLSGGRVVPSTVTIWTAGFTVPDLARRSGLTVDATGRLLTDETLTSVDDARILAAGDSVAPSDLPFRMGCQSAVQLGPQAAETILSRIAGEDPASIDVGFVGLCISLGPRAGIFQFARRDDTTINFYLGGRLGARVKELVSRSTAWQLGYEGRKPGARTWWVKDSRRRQLLQAQRGSLAVPGRVEG